MNYIRIMTLAVCAIVASVAHAGSPDRPRGGVQLYLDVLGRAGVTTVASALPRGTGDSRVVFLDEELRFASYLAITPAGSRSADAMRSWWDQLRITIANQHGVVRTIVGGDLHLLEARVNGRLIAGKASNYATAWDEHANVVRFSIAPLPPGDYLARAEFRAPNAQPVRSASAFFVVRRGDEDESMKRLHLPREAEETHTCDQYKRIMLEIHALEPDNAGIIERIAEGSLNIAPPSETLAWFRQAREMREAGAARYIRERGNKLTTEERRNIDDQLASVSLFEKIYPTYVAHQRDRKLVIIGGGYARQYAWFNRDGGMIGVIDLHDPTVVRPITVRQSIHEMP